MKRQLLDSTSEQLCWTQVRNVRNRVWVHVVPFDISYWNSVMLSVVLFIRMNTGYTRSTSNANLASTSNDCLPRERHSEAAHEKRLLCAQKCTWGRVGGSWRGGVGWVVHEGVGWVGHEGVGWGRVGHEGMGWGGVCHVEEFTFNFLWVTLTQKIITCRLWKIHKWIWGDVYEQGQSFLSHDKWQIKLLSEFFPIHIQHITSDSNWENNNSYIGFQKFMTGFGGMCVRRGKFLEPWQVTDKIIEWIFSQFTFNILWVTLTQNIITHRVSKIHEWVWGDVYEQGQSFLSHDKWQIKLVSEFFPIHIQHFTSYSNSENNNS